MFDSSARAFRVAFDTRRGEEVTARLDLPRGRLRAYALFAHCFGPSGEDSARAFVGGLLEYGLGVLSFELTAPVAPAGDEAGDATVAVPATDAPDATAAVPLALDTQDVIDAALELRVSHGPAELLVGHSLAGAAVLRAATQLSDVRGVATVGAPSDVTHMLHLLEDDLATAEARGEARLWVADRFCRVRASFLAELDESAMRSDLQALKRPLLVAHSPLDNVIGIDNARRIYDAARHPKSFVSLAGADHEFSRPAQAHVAGELVGAWVATVLPPEPPPPDEWREDGVAYARTRSELRTEASAGGFPLLLDEAPAAGGTDAGPEPYDLLATALASSASMALRRRADEEGWPLVEVTVRATHVPAAGTGGGAAERDRFEVEVTLVGPELTAEQRGKLRGHVRRAPVYLTLVGASELVVLPEGATEGDVAG